MFSCKSNDGLPRNRGKRRYSRPNFTIRLHRINPTPPFQTWATGYIGVGPGEAVHPGIEGSVLVHEAFLLRCRQCLQQKWIQPHLWAASQRCISCHARILADLLEQASIRWKAPTSDSFKFITGCYNLFAGFRSFHCHAKKKTSCSRVVKDW